MATPSPTSSAHAPAEVPSHPSKSEGTPVASFRYGPVSAAVFANIVKKPGGKSATKFDVSLRKSYRTADGHWVQTHTLGADDLLSAGFLLSQCATYIVETREAAGR